MTLKRWERLHRALVVPLRAEWKWHRLWGLRVVRTRKGTSPNREDIRLRSIHRDLHRSWNRWRRCLPRRRVRWVMVQTTSRLSEENGECDAIYSPLSSVYFWFGVEYVMI